MYIYTRTYTYTFTLSQDRLLARRLAGTLERGGFSCTGDHEADENEPGRVCIQDTECRCVFFVVSPGAPVDAAVVAQLRGAAGAGRSTRCIYEAGNSACQDLSEWGSAMPTSFLRPAVPISRYFPRVSERLVMAAAHEELLRAPPRQVDADGQADWVRGFPADPGGRFAAPTREFQSLVAGDEGQDHADFAQLANLTCTQWLQARDLQLVFGADEGAEALRCILEEKSYPAVSSAVMLLGAAYRPIYTSFVRGDLHSRPVSTSPSHAPTTPMSHGQTPHGHTPHCQTPKSAVSVSGPFSCAVPSESQLMLLEQALQNLPGGCNESTAIGFCVMNGVEGPGMPEVLLASHIAVLEGVSVSMEEHLEHGENFVEVVVAIITGRLVPCRENQLQELDAAVGEQLEPGGGVTLSQLVDADAEGSGNLINKICLFVQTKAFQSGDTARAWWTRHCRRALETHPLLQGRAYRRTLLQNCVSTDSLSIASLQQRSWAAKDLINNECANALAETAFKVRVVSEAPTEMKPENTETDNVDWGEQVNQTRLKDLRKLMRCLFQAFDADLDKNNQARYHQFTRCKFMHFLSLMVHSDIFAITFAVLTIYTLFAPNILLVFGLSTEHTAPVAILNTVVLGFFVLECILSCIFMNGYLRSGRVFLDIMAMVSLVGDTLIQAHFFPMTPIAQPSMETSQLDPSRPSRILDILKFARLFRIVQLLRTLHGIVWRNFLRPHHGLAQQLYHKRLWRVFQDLCEGKKTQLSAEQMRFFFMAMRLEFPERKVGMSKSKVFRSNVTASSAFANRQYGTMMSLKPAALTRLSTFAPSWDLHPKTNCDGTFASLIDEFAVRPEGKRALQKCQEDVQRVKASFSLVQKVSGPVVVKVCLIVLGVMGVVILLDASWEDHGDYQHLAHLDHLASSMTQSRSCAALCANVEDFVVASLPHVVKLVGIHHVYWTPSSCECSTPQPWLPSAQLAMDADPKQPHELQLVCYPNEDCTGSPTSVSLMDTYVSVRRNAEADLVYTLIVVVLMVIFALAFMHALNKVNTRMLHPLWNILDDMASLRSLEAVRMTNFQPASNMLKDLQQGGKKRSTCRRLLRYAGRSSSWCSESKKEDDVKELADLRVSLSTMRAALRNWAKYVPPYLLKSLYRHGIEARVGLNPNEVSIFFCDIDRFKEMCRESTPKEVLAILSLVHGEVSNAIEAQAGTLLEFVGDEVLAVFNAPNEVDDHEEHAVASATDVLERAGRLGVRMRCGVHSGKVLVGNIGSQTRIKYGVLGDSVNVAARLKSLNSHFRTCCLVSDESLEEADDLHKSYVARPVGNLVLKGRKSPTKVWEVCARRCAAQQTLAKTYDAHRRAFELFMDRRFGEARPLLAEVCRSLRGRSSSVDDDKADDIPSKHLLDLCDKFIREPPPLDWDGSESMTKK
ncbi:Adenylate cyclase 1 (ATP pyrophosphate-lyase 1) (Adenylyl cyclase 1) [Durusdinium trenchii]|uniref:Adenylate cyclase 1 (ATP pyrophosphate-lyase 1) (Adenylyl cyclase 1) n=1 Tax=Durusdinium trenchii TaxID=1381693 RepID=A0ABP0QHN5_9DINO